ncbi:hypothetical protein L202_04168 [Cryptococcus amylolentus CBS 6039]|uniref:Zn(2)-C6 fungal-type domain-containing protein n=1 Tax=Cryptococcus amylolentus CBS 6039 TaxID=1295533 RepID=A0A1E3HQE7_9TREE|nr:hypothetical protein L202_04168 [Cryptococcus amylolentus CBS 6039]ODN78552.1 hypothetical protein L202_04168 [Cryptococcus amylolentus CBS 6039]
MNAPAAPPPPPPPPARPKRTHARRSCATCRLRKSRCELPDLDVPAGPEPLPIDKACHRCKVLSIPCIVDDGNRKRKRKEASASTPDAFASDSASQAGPSTARRRIAKPQASPLSQSTVHRSDNSLDIVNSLSSVPGGPTPTSAEDLVENYERLKRELGARGLDGESGKTKSIKLHGRPLELACAMLRVAYGRNDKRGKRVRLEDDEVELEDLVDDDMRLRLRKGVAQLRTYHPHLDDLDSMMVEYRRNPEPTIALLIATVVYLASAVLPPDVTVHNLRNALDAYIYQRRDSLLLHHPHTFFALQALELFITHCPFGVLPLQPTNLQNLGVAKGLTAAARAISAQLCFEQLVQQLLNGPGIAHNFYCGDLWLWLSLIASEAAAMLEESNPHKPKQLAEARSITDSFLGMTDLGSCLWRDGIGKEDMSVLVGKLALCDKVARLEEVLDGMARIKGVLEHSTTDLNVDPVIGILTEFDEYTRRTDAIDQRHDSMMSMLREYSENIEVGSMVYRAIRRRYEFSKIHVTGLRALIATHYLPGSLYAYPDLPPPSNPHTAVSYAISRACNPPDIVRFISDTNHNGGATPAVQAVWEWGRKRGVNMERNLLACSQLAVSMNSELHGVASTCVVPLHETICIAVESAKVLMEMEAGTIHILRSNNQLYKAFRPRSWLDAMRDFAQALRAVSVIIHDDGLGGETVASGASNLIGSMVRTAEDWTKSLEQEAARPLEPMGFPTEMTLDSVHALARQRQGHGNGVSVPQQGYMDTSDRWMASSEQELSSTSRSQSAQGSWPTPPTVVGTPNVPNVQQVTPLDMLLSEMFGYSCNPPQPPSKVAMDAK